MSIVQDFQLMEYFYLISCVKITKDKKKHRPFISKKKSKKRNSEARSRQCSK